MSKFRHHLVTHDEFLKRVRKSLYYYDKSQVSVPFSDLIAETFSETHVSYSLHRMKYATIGHLQTTPVPLILAMIYLERLKETDPVYVKHITPTELFLVSMMVATKYYSGYDDDETFPDWAKYGCISHKKLIQMELQFLMAIDWNIYVSDNDFYEKLNAIEEVLAKRQGLHRGWFTYMELYKLLPALDMTKSLLQFYVILGLTYAAFFAIILGSVNLVSQIPGSYLSKTSVSSDVLTTSVHQQPITKVHNTSTIPIDKTGNENESDNDNIVIVDDTDLDNQLNLLTETINKATDFGDSSLKLIDPGESGNYTRFNYINGDFRHKTNDSETNIYSNREPVICVPGHGLDLNFFTSENNLYHKIVANDISNHLKNTSKYHLFLKAFTKY